MLCARGRQASLMWSVKVTCSGSLIRAMSYLCSYAHTWEWGGAGEGVKRFANRLRHRTTNTLPLYGTWPIQKRCERAKQPWPKQQRFLHPQSTGEISGLEDCSLENYPLSCWKPKLPFIGSFHQTKACVGTNSKDLQTEGISLRTPLACSRT